MYDILMSKQFQRDLDRLDKAIRAKVTDTVRMIADDPYRHKGLGTEKQRSVSGRKIMRSRVNYQYRLLWEYLPQGQIGVWRVGNHPDIDAVTTLPGISDTTWQEAEAAEADTAPVTVPTQAAPGPFNRFHPNQLRLFGVPDDQVENVKTLGDAEDLWDLPLPENVQGLLIDLLTREDDDVDILLDPKQLLYRSSVDLLEGYCQGHIKRLMLNLNAEQQRLVNMDTNGPLLIKGVAGSGKTTIGIYRTQRLAELIYQQPDLFEQPKGVLVLTYTRVLERAIGELLAELYGSVPKGVTVDRTTRWMVAQLTAMGQPVQFMDERERLRVIEQAHDAVLKTDERPEAQTLRAKNGYFYKDEFDRVIDARHLTTLDAYQQVDRVGRGTGLDRERQRPLVWAVYQRYVEAMNAQGQMSYAQLPGRLLAYKDRLTRYEAIIVDEAQDLTPVQLRVLANAVRQGEKGQGFTLLADPAQSIYYRGIPWKEGGVNIHGSRSRTLEKNYRNTRQILAVAQDVLAQFEDLQASNEYVAPTSTKRSGPKPVLALYHDQDAGRTYLIEQIVRLAQSGRYRPGDMAVLARDKKSLEDISNRLARQSIPMRSYSSDDFSLLENHVKLITMHSAKGLEFPVVFLVDLAEGSIPPRLWGDDAEERLLSERKLFYVSMTRASDRLYLLAPHHYGERSRFVKDIDEDKLRVLACEQALETASSG